MKNWSIGTIVILLLISGAFKTFDRLNKDKNSAEKRGMLEAQTSIKCGEIPFGPNNPDMRMRINAREGRVGTEQNLNEISEIEAKDSITGGDIRYLLAEGADVMKIGYRGSTYLHRAASVGAIDILIEAGADIMAKDDQGRTPLHVAKNADVVKALLDAGSELVARDEFGRTPLHTATSAIVIKALLEAGANVKSEDEWGRTPLHLAKTVKNVQALLKGGANPMAEAKNGWKPLHLAAEAKCFSDDNGLFIEAYIQSGADIMAKMRNGYTPLHYAAENGNLEQIKLLLAAGADVEAENIYENTPWDLAQKAENHSMIYDLLFADRDEKIKTSIIKRINDEKNDEPKTRKMMRPTTP